jgi:hypothetical protein
MYTYAYYLSMHAYYVVIFLLFMDDAWKKEETLTCAKIGIVMPLLIFKFNAQIRGSSLFFDELSRFISKVKSYLCCHQSPRRGRLNVHLGP